MTSVGLDTVNTKFYSFILYFILFKERLLEKHRCIVVFVKLKMFQQEDNKEQDVSIIGSSIAKDIFFSILKLLISWLAGAFLHIFACFSVANINTYATVWISCIYYHVT